MMDDRQRQQESIYNHINSAASLLESLIERSHAQPLGPADGKLYMQLCDTLTEYYRSLERAFRESNPESKPDSGGGKSPDAGHEGGGSSGTDG